MAADGVVEAGLTIEVGPTRHAIGDVFFLYVHDPGSDYRTEMYSGEFLNFEPDRRIIKGRPFAVRSECEPKLYREEHPL